MKTKPSDIITEVQLMKWLGLSDYQVSELRNKGIPRYTLTRELRLYNRIHVIEWLETYYHGQGEPKSIERIE